MRGEYIPVLAPPPPAKGSPPLARGIHMSFKTSTSGPRITPACAGNTLPSVAALPASGDHPRLRGEYTMHSEKNILERGSPPLARGIQYRRNTGRNRNGITPACAGNTRWSLEGSENYGDHPRLRGEYKRRALYRACRRGSPPLARGIPRMAKYEIEQLGITPACAGNTASLYPGS